MQCQEVKFRPIKNKVWFIQKQYTDECEITSSDGRLEFLIHPLVYLPR